jgi:hypothetical protein
LTGGRARASGERPRPSFVDDAVIGHILKYCKYRMT